MKCVSYSIIKNSAGRYEYLPTLTVNEQRILKMKEKGFSQRYRPLFKKLQQAILDYELEMKTDAEEGIIAELNEKLEILEQLKKENKKLEKERLEKEEKLEKTKLVRVALN